MAAKLVAYTQGVKGETPEELLARAFSQCYQKDANIDVVLKHLKHKSVLEHVSFTFEIKLSRVAWEQLVRHRIASYTAQSHRYTEVYLDDCLEYIPPQVTGDLKLAGEWMEDIRTIYMLYRKWRGKGIKKEMARYLVMKGVGINATWTINLRSLLNFLELRTDPHAQDEIREFAEDVWRMVKPLFPRLGEKLEEEFRGC